VSNEIFSAIADSSDIERSLIMSLKLDDNEVRNDAGQKYIEADDLLQDLNEEESGEIYNALINKKVI
jgi:hypothetical protein